jgi:hypothetical protein
MIYFDLDGVIRDLHGALNWKPTKWEETIKGVNFYEYIDSHPEVLLDANPTEYCEIIKQHNPLIISAQPNNWRLLTLQWLVKHVPNLKGIIFTDTPNDKFKHVRPSDFLIEDCPRLKSYSNVILIDRPWNQDVKTLNRIKTPSELDEVLRNYNKRTSTR